MHKCLIKEHMFILLIILIATENSLQQCLCNVRFVGEYCGTVLNEKSGNTHCGRHMYYCGKSNLNKEAVLLKSCTNPGFECDVKLNGGNACYRNVQCACTPQMRRKGKYCGSELRGSECSKDVVYKCPMFRRNNATPEDACPNGCKDGKCIEQ